MTESTSAPQHATRPHRASIGLADGEVISVAHLAGDQVVMRIACPVVAAQARPGSFVHLRCAPELAMRRPMSIMRAAPAEGWFDMLFKVHGHGSALLAARRPGEAVSVLGPIGRPFRLAGYRRRPLLIGGGVGIPPMIFLAEHLRAQARDAQPLVLMGSEVPFPFTARPSAIMVAGLDPAAIAAMPLLDDWGIASRLASTQGYAGCFDGFVTELARAWITASGTPREDIEIFACGPTPMLRAVQALAAEYALPCEISLEEYMACAVGGCAGCVVRIETETGPAMKRVCVDGPVFDAARVVFDA
ncbi:MAG: dihydroorotate dehydrogenase electron transfer subunit [Gammaproteobacteria bacterium]|nr:dihydroorotate dehydrogenase electron transfer subunit [Gammaproteobacteria bacterium]MCP5200487.1 dihydroorotate dehydrogenase electron transfer subunit [Gammaproteobacteria bacterium]